MTMSQPQSYEILLVPKFTEGPVEAPKAKGASEAPESADAGDARSVGAPIRSAVVEATGETGASGYPRYAGEGMVADIDPATHTVEALLVDGAELDLGLSVRISERTADS
ncbi:hypothetical protein [Streptomyces sp. NBC_01320]|uniref:hypothetical protein n=1 Tax=Streptomyces sp. NBC_01320 TaxID=2903824 RepID=UPI003FA3C168